MLSYFEKNIVSMALEGHSSSKIADELASQGLITTSTEINKYLRDLRIPRPMKVITHHKHIKQVVGKGNYYVRQIYNI